MKQPTEDQQINIEVLGFLADQFQGQDSFRYSIEDETSALIILGCTGNPTEDHPDKIKTLGRIMGNSLSIKQLLLLSMKKNPELKDLLEEAIQEFNLMDFASMVVKTKQK